MSLLSWVIDKVLVYGRVHGSKFESKTGVDLNDDLSPLIDELIEKSKSISLGSLIHFLNQELSRKNIPNSRLVKIFAESIYEAENKFRPKINLSELKYDDEYEWAETQLENRLAVYEEPQFIFRKCFQLMLIILGNINREALRKLSKNNQGAIFETNLESFVLSRNGLESKLKDFFELANEQEEYFILPEFFYSLEKVFSKTKPYEVPFDEPDSWQAISTIPLLKSFLSDNIGIYFPDHFKTTHTLISGASGSGKTVTMKHLIKRELECVKNNNTSMVLIDGSTQLVEEILQLKYFESTKGELIEKLVLFDAKDSNSPISFNPYAISNKLKLLPREEQEGLLNLFDDVMLYILEGIFEAELTSAISNVFSNLNQLVLKIENSNVMTAINILESETENEYSHYYDQLSEGTRSFFEKEFYQRTTYVSRRALVRKLRSLLRSPTMERVFLGNSLHLDMTEMLNNNKVIILSTDKSVLGEYSSRVLGRFFVGLISISMFQRNNPNKKVSQTTVYIDECQDIVDNRTETILNQGRKAGIGLVLATQHLDQVPNSLRSSIYASVNTMFIGKTGRSLAREAALEMDCDENEIHNLHKNNKITQFMFNCRNWTSTALKLNVKLDAFYDIEKLNRKSRPLINVKMRDKFLVVEEKDENSSTISSSKSINTPQVNNDKLKIASSLVTILNNTSEQKENSVSSENDSAKEGLPPNKKIKMRKRFSLSDL